jgi:hypothetical protein
VAGSWWAIWASGVRHQRVEGFEVLGEHGKANNQSKHGAASRQQIAVLETVSAHPNG